MCMVELYPWDILLVAVELVSWSHYWGYNYGRLLLCSAIFFELLLLHQYVALSHQPYRMVLLTCWYLLW